MLLLLKKRAYDFYNIMIFKLPKSMKLKISWKFWKVKMFFDLLIGCFKVEDCTDAFFNKTVAFSNKDPVVFLNICLILSLKGTMNKIWKHNYFPLPKLDFLESNTMFMLCHMSLNPLSKAGTVYFHSFFGRRLKGHVTLYEHGFGSKEI